MIVTCMIVISEILWSNTTIGKFVYQDGNCHCHYINSNFHFHEMSLSFHAELAASKCTRCLDEFGFVWGAQSKFTEWTKLSYTISTLCTIWCLVMGDLRSVYITALQWYNILWCKDQSKRLNEHCTSVHVEVCQLPSHTITTRIWAVFTSTDHLTTYCFYLSEQYCFLSNLLGLLFPALLYRRTSEELVVSMLKTANYHFIPNTFCHSDVDGHLNIQTPGQQQVSWNLLRCLGVNEY